MRGVVGGAGQGRRRRRSEHDIWVRREGVQKDRQESGKETKTYQREEKSRRGREEMEK